MFQQGCQIHLQEEYKFICLNQHTCQRKLCAECFDDHQMKYPNSQYTTIKKFLEKQNQSFELIDSSSGLSLSYKEIQQKISEAELKYKKLFQVFQQSFEILYLDLQDSTLQYQVFKEKLREQNIESFTINELQLLIQIEQNDSIQKFNTFHSFCVDSLYNNVNQLLNQLTDYYEDLHKQVCVNNEIIEKSTIYEGVEGSKIGEIYLTGDKLFGMIHGDCEQEIYIDDLDYTEIRKAGQYQFDRKIGYWRETGQFIQCEGNYLNGKRTGSWKFVYNYESIAECEYDQLGRKIGNWKEIYVKSQNDPEMIIQQGNYVNDLKTGHWQTFYRKQPQADWEEIGGGEYDNKGNKIGKWIDINLTHYKDSAQIISVGYYKDNLRVKNWKTLYREDRRQSFKLIGNGEYNNEGQKFGLWQEINENRFNKDAQIIMKGKYQSDLKVGSWETLFREDSQQDFQLIGEGLYDSNGHKTDVWTEISENQFSKYSQIIMKGKYSENYRSGQWDILQRSDTTQDFIQIGGGEYDSKGEKSGRWREISETEYNNNSQVLWEGEYKYGLRTGEWKIFYRENDSEDFQEIGGGFYGEIQNKIGNWKDIIQQQFNKSQQIIWQGEYKSGVKVGQWQILYRDNGQIEFQQIGGGFFNEDGKKTGTWKDISENNFKDTSQIIWEGFYMDGVKIGEWKILYRDDSSQDFNIIGGGLFDEEGLKTGEWRIANEKQFKDIQQIIWEGHYHFGLRIGEWKILYRDDSSQDFIQIGGGYYNDSKKIGKWEDINENQYSSSQQIILSGQYKAGFKVGSWQILFRKQSNADFEIIGGGQYNHNGMKVDLWQDIDEIQYNTFQQIIWEGQYSNGVKVGDWKILYRENDQTDFKQLGGGKYDENGQKDGKWRDLKENQFDCQQQIIWKGYYKSGKEVGEWQILLRNESSQDFKQIGGGSYNDQGQKIGKWLEIEYDWSIKVIEKEYNQNQHDLKKKHSN